MNKDLQIIKAEVDLQLTDKENSAILLQTTFNGLTADTARRAMIEGMIRGFDLRDFLEKNVYAIPFKSGYSLVTSIDYARKIGMRSGIVGKSAPTYEESKEGKIISCTVTVKRKVNDYVGDYTATVYFAEYTTGRNLWVSKPRTMLAKVAEMHALRMACPEEMAQMYSEEELEKGEERVLDFDLYQQKIESAKDLQELQRVWSALPAEAKTELTDQKDEAKKKFIDTTAQSVPSEPVPVPPIDPMNDDEAIEEAVSALTQPESSASKQMKAGMKTAYAHSKV